jgi:hypothetical protein
MLRVLGCWVRIGKEFILIHEALGYELWEMSSEFCR